MLHLWPFHGWGILQWVDGFFCFNGYKVLIIIKLIRNRVDLVQWIQEKEREVVFSTANMLSLYVVRCYLKLMESVLWQTQDGFHDIQWREFIAFANFIIHDALEKNFSASTTGSASTISGSKLSGKSWIVKAVLGSVRPDTNQNSSKLKYFSYMKLCLTPTKIYMYR